MRGFTHDRLCLGRDLNQSSPEFDYRVSFEDFTAVSAGTCSRWFLAGSSTLKMEEIRASETSVHTRSTRLHISEYDILHYYRGFPLQEPVT
jgi:hypothetical protein